MTTNKAVFLSVALAGFLVSCGDESSEIIDVPIDGARYKATLSAEWSTATHPDMFPNNPHFSPLIGATHAATDLLWREGGTATNGVEVMAETGGTTALESEVAQAVQSGSAGAVVTGSGINPSPGSATATFVVTPEHPLLTLVTMIAPSPDWFIGVNGLKLLDDQGQWRERVEVDLFAYDAGTDNGDTYAAADIDTSPKGMITKLQGGDFGVRFGTLVLERQPE